MHGDQGSFSSELVLFYEWLSRHPKRASFVRRGKEMMIMTTDPEQHDPHTATDTDDAQASEMEEVQEEAAEERKEGGYQ